MAVRDVTDSSFEELVIEASRRKPVVVDFWASWCGPCKSLSPIIERVGSEHASEIDTLKMDVDANPNVSSMMGIRSIPTVVAFKDGAAVDAFLGAQPEGAVKEFFKRLLPPEELEIARSLIDRGQFEQAREVLKRIPADDRVQRLLAEIDIASAPDDLSSLESAAVADPAARVRYGIALAKAQQYEEALAALFSALRDGERDAARAAMIDIFTLLGDENPLVVRSRRELASVLF
ncbi:MAG: thioredoxin [Actinomycetota bacterium]